MGEGFGAKERQHEILALARANGRLDVTSVAVKFGVAAETVRRDLRALEKSGLVRRSYGSAFPTTRAGFESDLASRETNHLAEKQRIAAEAVLHLHEAETLFIDEGYLPRLVAEDLPLDRNLTIVTASLPVAAILAPRHAYTVFLLGGLVRGRTLATVEHWAAGMLGEFVIDLAFLGANGISLADGLTTPDPRVAEIKSAAIKAARRRIFVGSYDKFGTSSFCRFASINAFEVIITDDRMPMAMARQYSAAGPSVVRC